MEIPENVRQTLGVIAKYHFWILATLVPAIALTVLWIGNSALTVRIKQQRQKIQSTLRLIEDGSYGYCLETGEEIGIKRLEARPVATLSLEAQERRERREKQYGDRDDRYR